MARRKNGAASAATKVAAKVGVRAGLKFIPLAGQALMAWDAGSESWRLIKERKAGKRRGAAEVAARIAGASLVGSEGVDWAQGKLQKNPSIRSNGVYDPAILKAVFLAGGPGSGKSHVASALFDIPNNSKVLVTTAATGLKIVNSDPLFEMYLRKMGVDPKSLSSLSKEEFYELTETKTGPRIRAKEASNRLFESWLREKLGLLLDGTGDDFSKIKTKSDRLRKLGYDTKMLFVNTSLDVAKSRNRKRSRVLPDALVEETWYAVQNNLGLFQRYFGVENFVIVDASENGPPPVEALTAARRLLSRPLTNRIGLAWVRKELAARPGMSKRGGRRRAKSNPDECSMCQGTGIVSRYAHVEGGRCFACKGTGG